MARDKKDAQKMKLGFWSKLGGWFRGSAITTLSTAAVVPALRFVVGPIVARSGASWAGALASVADTLWLGGVGLQLLGAVAIPAVFVTVAYAVSPKFREHMKQKALLAKLQKALKRNKELTLTEEQKQLLTRALENPKMSKLIDGGKFLGIFNRKGIGREILEKIAEQGTTKPVDKVVEPAPAVVKPVVPEHVEEIVKDEVKDKDTTIKKGKNDDLYAKITRKNLFTMTLSARETLELQQIYNAAKKEADKKVKELEALEKPTEAQKAELEAARELYKKYDLLERRAYTFAKKLIQAEVNDPNTAIPDDVRKIYNDFLKLGRRSKIASAIITDNGKTKSEEVATNLSTIVETRKKERSNTGNR